MRRSGCLNGAPALLLTPRARRNASSQANTSKINDSLPPRAAVDRHRTPHLFRRGRAFFVAITFAGRLRRAQIPFHTSGTPLCAGRSLLTGITSPWRAVEGFAGACQIVWMVVPVVVEERLERHPIARHLALRRRVALPRSALSAMPSKPYPDDATPRWQRRKCLLLAHCCPEPKRCHVRSWRKET